MAEQLLYDNKRRTIIKGFSITRGDTKELTFDHDLGAAAAVKTARFFVRSASTADTGTAVIQLTKADHSTQWDFTTSGKGVILLQSSDTEGITVSSGYQYAVELTDQSDRVYTPVKGDFDIAWDGVHDDDTAAYLSYNTLSDYTTLWNAILNDTNIQGATVAAAASSGAGTITVASVPAGWSNSDTVQIQLDTAGTYDERTITISGTTITLNSNLTDDVAIGNLVMKEF